MKGGVTKRIEDSVQALEKGQVKRALFLTDSDKTRRHHDIVAGAASKCLSDKEQCQTYLQDAAEKLRDTITAPLESTDLEGVEEMIEQESPQAETPPADIKTDEEIYAECEECHVSDAVLKFHKIAEHCGDAETLETIESTLGDDLTPPEEWLKKMVAIAEKPSCGEESYKSVLGELTEYLEGRSSPILKQMDEKSGGESDA